MTGTPNRHGEQLWHCKQIFCPNISNETRSYNKTSWQGRPKSHMGPSFAHTSPPDIGLVWVKWWSHITEGTLRHVVLFLFLRNQFKSILSMYRPTGGYRSHHILNRFETSEPSEFNTPIENEQAVHSGSFEFLVFNTESYGRHPVLENLRMGKRQKQIFVIEGVNHC